MSFRISGLDPAPFRPLFGLTDAALAARGARRMIVDASPSFPDRIELRDLDVGEQAILVNHVHHDVDGPYRASHAIFVLEGAREALTLAGAVPEVIRRRPISLRAFDAAGDMVDAALIDGADIEGAIARMFGDARIDFLHAHYATRGCYAARIDRA
jgi:hypothetical protein